MYKIFNNDDEVINCLNYIDVKNYLHNINTSIIDIDKDTYYSYSAIIGGRYKYGLVINWSRRYEFVMRGKNYLLYYNIISYTKRYNSIKSILNV